MSSVSRSRWSWLILAALLLGGLAVASFGDGGPRTTEERARSLGQSIKCPVCEGQSIADSNAAVARSIRTEVARRIETGETDEQIRDYIGGLYGDEYLLAPPRSGVGGLVWFLPVALLVVATGALAAAFRRWQAPLAPSASDEDHALVDEALRR